MRQEQARQVNNTTFGTLWMQSFLANVLVILLVDPMIEFSEKVVRKVALSYGGGEEFRGYAKCARVSCPAIPPLSGPRVTISESDQGESNGMTQSCKD